MTSYITHLAGAFSDSTMSKLVRDKAITKGTRLLFDFKSSYSNPNADGTMTLGAPFVNVVDGAPGASIGGSATYAFINNRGTTGGIKAPGAAGNGHVIGLGNTYSLHAGSHSFIALAWVKCPSDAVANSYQSIFQLIGASNQNTMFSIDTGADGKSPRVVANNQNNAPIFNAIPGFTAGAVHQIGVSWQPGFVDVILDGVVVLSFANVNMTLLDLSSYNMTALTARQSTTLYRLFLEDLSVSGRSPTAAASADFLSASGRFA